MAERIVLAHVSPFAIGRVTVQPATRTVVHRGAEIVIEPRVMQVLVALAEADGAVVSRDDLVERCWDGRIVGDDAINRVIGRLRALAIEVGADVFRIETITRVGYRLMPIEDAPGAGAPLAVPPADVPADMPVVRRDRRRMLAVALGGVVAAGAGLGGGVWWWEHRDPLPAAARAAVRRGRDAIRNTMPDQTAAAIAAFREATLLAPDAAEPWGQLALAYRQQLVGSGAKNAADLAQIAGRVRDAAAHALTRDPDNGDARVALATMSRVYGYWREDDRLYRELLARYPDHPVLNRAFAALMAETGQLRAALPPILRAIAVNGDWPQYHTNLVMSYWHSGRIDDADRAMDRAFAIWPRHYSIWFMRERLLAYTGRAAQALAMIGDVETRPIGIPDDDFAGAAAEARALDTRAPADIDAAARTMIDWAKRGAGFAINAMFFLVAVGRLDEAFRVIDGYFFDAGFSTGPHRYTPEQGMYDLRRDRQTYQLLVPITAPLRADPRFAPLLVKLGLEDYWRATGNRPDFRR